MVDVEYGPQPAPHSREPGRTGHELEVLLGSFGFAFARRMLCFDRLAN